MGQRFDLVDLQLFLHIAEAASITHGASRANMSLAAASERVRAMEEMLGARLLDRRRRGVELTPAGSVLVHHANGIVHRFEQMRGELSGYANGLRGHIRILAPTGALPHLLPELVAEFLARHPNLDVEIEERFSHQIAREVSTGHAEVGVVIHTSYPEAVLESFPLFPDNRIALVAPRNHPLAAACRTSFEAALQYEFVARPANTPLQWFVERQAENLGQRLKVRARLSSFEMLAYMVGHGVGLAVMPEFTAKRWSQTLPVQVVGLTDAWGIRPLMGCVRDFASLSPHASRLVEFLRANAPAAAARADA